MKKLLLTLITLMPFGLVKAQTKTIGPAETKLNNQLCDCITKLDKEKIKTSKEANEAFMNCFTQQADLLPDVATERGVEMTDNEAMNKIGTEIGANLMKMKCDGFMALAMKMAAKDDKDAPESKTITGTFKRIDTKGFNYVVLNVDGKERTFLWFRQFAGSDAFSGQAARLVGKKIQLTWQETEAYLPAAKGYYNVKEITGIEILK
ncbi:MULTISPECIES: hypothetical protein [unclassified Mucilaginibacter]|uniref:hypothetical protein n=1 Tax=unclassified Mucilaginibacter TaxID=2617802 RepID=UPI00095B03ED|nr:MULTISPECIES: hypothetical protein [unclassified Mucilaginibacter]OJW12988.1 MAG: hypothetical protein BGO48_14735 [Mucilaginibacter sp. 44-25]PLW88608.1 MAG: hypothetical protein C0154_15735 [Mucilaginibacter sp.]HEK19459.1 hypothetical protein [Bacteroidota bacterium]